MNSIIAVIDVKIYVIWKSKRHTLKITPTLSDHIGSIITEWRPVLGWNYV